MNAFLFGRCLRQLVVLGAILSTQFMIGRETILADEGKIDEKLEQGSLKLAAELIASRVHDYAKTRSKNTILVGTIDGPNTSGGRALEAEIRQRLEKKGVSLLKDDAELIEKEGWKLEGKIITVKDRPLLLVKMQMFDHTNDEVDLFRTEFNKSSTDSDSATTETTAKITKEQQIIPSENRSSNVLPITGTDAAVAAGATVDPSSDAQKKLGPGTKVFEPKLQDALIAPGLGSQLLTAAVKKSLTDPEFHIVQGLTLAAGGNVEDGTVVRASADSPFGIRIRRSRVEAGLPDKDYSAVKITTKVKMPFADLKEGDLYIVDILNQSPISIGAEVLIDGINTMRFADDPQIKKTGKWVIGHQSKLYPVRGWYRKQGDEGVQQFEVTDAKRSVAVSLGEAHKTGMIQVLFFSARKEGDPIVLADDLLGNGRGGFTGFGPKAEFRGEVQDWVFGNAILALITIRYDNPTDLPPK